MSNAGTDRASVLVRTSPPGRVRCNDPPSFRLNCRPPTGLHFAIVPRTPVAFDGVSRAAWWRIDPKTGPRVVVTDDGLHQAAEVTVTHNRSRKETTITYRYYVGDTNVVNLAETDSRTFVTGGRAMGQFLEHLLSAGRVTIRELVIP